MPIIFLDESGQFNKHNGESFFIVASFTTGDPKRVGKRFRSFQRNHYPRQSRYQPEIKFSDITIDDRLRLKTLQTIANLDVRIHYTYLKRENIPLDYRHEGKIRSGHLYTQIIGDTLELYLPTVEQDFRVFCDQRHLKGMTRSEYRRTLTERLLPDLPADPIIQIEMLDSTTSSNIQIADWIAGALARYYEEKPLGQDCFEILKNNLLGKGKELFKESWNWDRKQKT